MDRLSGDILMSEFKLQCKCGQLQGLVRDFSVWRSTRAVCHCADCQAYARHLDELSDQGGNTLDEFGGTDVLQMTPAQITFHQGAEQLRCLRLTAKGLYRWYADCCKTPIANTIAPGLPFVGIVHTALAVDGLLDANVDAAVGPVQFYMQGRGAIAPRPGQKVHNGFPVGWFLATFPWFLLGKIRRKQKPSPFFDNSGQPSVTPEVLG
jgi:hypothetical protein